MWNLTVGKDGDVDGVKRPLNRGGGDVVYLTAKDRLVVTIVSRFVETDVKDTSDIR